MNDMIMIRRLAEITDREKNIKYTELGVEQADGSTVKLIIKPGELWDARKVGMKLLDKGAKLEVSRETVAKIEALATQIATENAFIAKRGWNQSPWAFNIRDDVLGPNAASYRVDPNTPQSSYGQIRRAGDLNGALLLAEECFCSVALTMGLCAGYAALVVSFLKMNPFLLMFFGESKSGKTTAALLAVCHFGQYRESHLMALSGTGAGVEEAAVHMAGWPTVLDETATMNLSVPNLVNLVRERVFNFSHGREKVRASSYNNGLSGREISGLVIITGVKSISCLAKQVNIDMTDGMASRLMEVQAHQKNNETCIDLYPKGMSDKEKTAYGRRKLKDIHALMAKNHGLTHEAFILKMLENPAAVEVEARLLMEEFKKHPDTLSNDSIQHAVNSYSTLYVGGRLAMKWGLMPNKPEKLLAHLQRGLKRLEWRGKEDEKIASRAYKKLLLAIEAAPARSKLANGDADTHPMFRRKAANGDIEYVVSVKEMRRLAGDARCLNLLFERLIRQGMITIRHHEERTWTRKVQLNVAWPDRKCKAILIKAIR